MARRSALFTTLILLLGHEAQAAEPRPEGEVPTTEDRFAAFPLRAPHEPHWVRASVEVSAIVGVGFVDYLLNTAARGGLVRKGDERWTLRYNWPELRGKLVGDSYELDGNRFATNYVSHPVAGSVYFQAARSNHLSFAESFMLSAVGSTVWEYFGEIRETLSVNDLLVTPIAGATLGETAMQLSGFFDRGAHTPLNGFLSFLFAPLKAINYLTDDAVPERAAKTDALGLPTGRGERWHEFDLHLGGGATHLGGAGGAYGVARPAATYADTRGSLDLRIVNLPDYRDAGHHSRLFSDGNMTELGFRLALSNTQPSLVDYRLRAVVVPFGYYYRSATRDPRGRLSGQSAILGLRFSYEYGEHAFDRSDTSSSLNASLAPVTPVRPRDLIAAVSPLGIYGEHRLDIEDSLSVRTGAEVNASIAGVRAYALPELLLAAPEQRETLPNSTRANGYYHALGVMAGSFAELEVGRAHLRGAMRFEAFRGITELERSAVGPLSDRRVSLQLSAGARVFGPVVIDVGAERTSRAGAIGRYEAQRAELAAFGSAGLVF